MLSRSVTTLVLLAILASATAIVLYALGRAPGNEANRRRLLQLYDEYRQTFPHVPSVSVDEAVELQRRGGRVLFVDVREPEEREISTIPGAITAAQLESAPDAYRGATIITYCTVGYRSGLFAEKLLAEGLAVYNLEGSILAWTHAGLPLEGADGNPTRRVHVYGRRWDLAAEGYEAVW